MDLSPKKKLKGIFSTMQDKLDDKEPEKESEVQKYLPKEGTPAFAIVRALRNETKRQLVRLEGNHDSPEKENYFEVQKRFF